MSLRALARAGLALLVAFASPVHAQPTLEDLPNLSDEELYDLLTPEQRAELESVLAEARARSEAILEEYRADLLRIEQEALDEGMRRQARRALEMAEAEEAALLEAIEAELRRQLFLVNLGPDAFQTGLYAWSGNDALCDARQTEQYALLDTICNARRPEGIPESLPPILDPIIVWHCNLPRVFAPEAIQRICDDSDLRGPAYDNPESIPGFAALQNMVRNYNIEQAEERRAREESRQREAARRLTLQECGETFRTAEMRDLMWLRSDADLSDLSEQQRTLVEEVRSCRDRFETENRELYRPFHFGSSPPARAEHTTYCRPYIRAYPRYHADVVALERNRHHRFGTAVRASVVQTIIQCRDEFSR